MKTLRTAATALAAAAALLGLASPAQASPEWIPDYVVILDAEAIEDWAGKPLGLSDGAVVPVTHTRCGELLNTRPCVLLGDPDHNLVLGGGGSDSIDAPTLAYVPAGPDNPDDPKRVYPEYSTLVEITRPLDYERYVRDGNPLDPASQELAQETVLDLAEGLEVWASDETVNADGGEWVRVGHGLDDWWAPVEWITPAGDEQEPDADVTPSPSDDPTTQPDVTSSPTPDVGPKSEAATNDDSGVPWLPLSLAGIGLAGGAVVLARRSLGNDERRQ